MLKTLGQLRQEAAQLAGIQDSNGAYEFDSTTFPTSTQANIFINDSIRELTSQWDYTFLESTKSMPFQHVISGVQSVWLSGNAIVGGAAISGTITPYPSTVLNYTWSSDQSVQDTSTNFSGITFIGASGVGVATSGISVSGAVVTANWTGVGYVYQLDADIDKILAPGILIQNTQNSQTANGVICQNTPFEDLMRMVPIGLINASGTPGYFSQMPGLSPANNIAIQFFPFPIPQYSGSNFTIPYKKRHVDLTSDSETQNVIPETWQYVITQAVLEKIFDLTDNPKAALATQRKEELIAKMKIWDANQPSKMWAWRDYNYNSSTNSAYDNSIWFTLGDGAR